MIAVAAAVPLLMAGCSSEPPKAYMDAIYPEIEGVEQAVEESDLIVVAEVLESREEIIYPEISFEGDPNTNPQAGLTWDDIDMDELGLPVTITEVRVVECLTGDCVAGEILEIEQMGGMMDGVEYVETGGLLLEDAASDQLVLFLSDEAGVTSLINPEVSVQALSDDGETLVAAESEDGETTTEGFDISVEELKEEIAASDA